MKGQKRLIWLMLLAGTLILCLFAGDAHAANYYSAESLTATNTVSTTYANKVQLQFTPESSDEQWVVVCTWRQCRVADDNADYFTGKSRITVNGDVRTGCDNITYKMRSARWKSCGYFFKITGTTSQQTIGIDFAAYVLNFTNSIDKASIIAFKIPNPGSADIHYSEWLTQETNATNPTDHDTTFTPSSSGDYIWMAAGFHHEGPGGASTGGLSAVDPDGTVQQLSSETWIGGSDGFVQLFHVQKITLAAASKTFKIRHQPDTTTGSHCQGLVQLVFRADAFNLVDYASSTAETYSNSTSYVTKMTLTTTSVGDTRDFIYLGTMSKNFRYSSGEAYMMYGQARVAGTQITEDITSSPTKVNSSQIPLVYAENCTGNRVLDYQYKTINASYEVMGKYAHLIALRYPPPNSAPNAPTIDNYNGGAWTNDSTPTLQFDMTDPDSGDIVKFQVQIDSGTSYPPDWASLTADYTETAGSPGYAVPRNDVTWTVNPALSNSATSSTYYYWRVKGIDDDTAEGSWAGASNGFRVDVTAPNTPPTVKCTDYLSLVSSGAWQNSIPNPSFKWDGTDSTSPGNDVLSGVNTANGYDWYFYKDDGDGSYDAGDTLISSDTASSTSASTAGPVDSPSMNFLRITTRDNAGNSYGPYTRFTFKYDATNPNVTVDSISEGTNPDYQKPGSPPDEPPKHIWFNSNYSGSFSVHTSQSDTGSGVWKIVYPSLGTGWTGGGEYVDPGSPTYQTYSWTASAAEPGTKTIYVYDGAISTGTGGNSNSTTFIVEDDSTSPTNPTAASETHAVDSGVVQRTVSDPAFTWSGAADTGGAGIAGYYWYFGTDSEGDPSTWTTSEGCDPSSVTTYHRHYLRVKTKDNVSNISAAATLFTFIYIPECAPTTGRSTSTWYQGDGDVETFDFSYADTGTKFTKFYYKWNRSQSYSVTTDDDSDWTSADKSLSPPNSKVIWLHVKPANSSDDLGPQSNLGPYYFVDTERLLRGGKFFDDDGNFIEQGPKSP